MTNELLSILSIFDWMYGDPDRYVTESLFTLIFSVFVLTVYVVMKYKKKQKEKI